MQAAQQAWANELGEQIGAAHLDATAEVLTRLLTLLAERRETTT